MLLFHWVFHVHNVYHASRRQTLRVAGVAVSIQQFKLLWWYMVWIMTCTAGSLNPWMSTMHLPTHCICRSPHGMGSLTMSGSREILELMYSVSHSLWGSLCHVVICICNALEGGTQERTWRDISIGSRDETCMFALLNMSRSRKQANKYGIFICKHG